MLLAVEVRAVMSEYLIMNSEPEEGTGMEEVIRQGFLCPFCMQDLGDLLHLQAHVERYHAESGSSDALDHLKGFLGKAKQKILQMDSPFSNFDISSLASSSTSSTPEVKTLERDFLKKREKNLIRARVDVLSIAQEIGVSRSHTEYFLKCRAPCINEAAVLTNNLIIRLDKLINQCPKDISKRKAFERDTVPWTADSEMKSCQACNSKFSLTKRRHHCRLCGRVICHSCSQFLSFVMARKMTNPAFAAQMLEELKSGCAATASSERGNNSRSFMTDAIKSAVSGESLQSVRKKSEKILTSTLSLMKRDGSEVSLSSLLQQDENEHLRICSVCKNLLDIRDEKMEQLSSPPILVLFYERLCSLFHEAHRLAPSYARMAESLNRGESMYTLESANQLRSKLINLQQEIDSLSLKIENLGTSDSEQNRPSPRELMLQKHVRYLAVQTIQDVAARMIALPSEDVYKQLQEKRRDEIKRQTVLERERNAFLVKNSPSTPALGELLQAEQPAGMGHLTESASFAGVLKDEGDQGWTISAHSACHYNPFVDDEVQIDPLQQQVLIIKRYLKQAAEDGRLEEVEILEGNLRDLENELERLNIALPPEE